MTMRQGSIKILSVSSIALLAVIGLGYVRAGQVAAQSPAAAPSNPNVLDAVQGVQSAVDSLQALVTALQESVDALAAPDEGNIRWTAPVRVIDERVGCMVANITDEPRTVRLQRLDGGGIVVSDITNNHGPGVRRLSGSMSDTARS
jgi:hypothetical protein